MLLAVQNCGLTLDEAFLGVTYNAAKSLLKSNEIGLIKKNYNADIILWNTDADEGNEIEWEWNSFDYISLDDYDALVNWNAYSTYGYYDWTHFNALDYDPQENVIYLSSRHLSRIYKISITTGEIIWSMGYDITEEDLYVNIDFS